MLQPPIAPMLAALADELPVGDGWLYEPKWDGFRCLVFRDGESLYLASRNERPFNRYFPELLEPLAAALPDRCVVDGEIVLPRADDRGLDFDALQQRLHPAESRVRRLSVETPTAFVAFDLLALGDRDLLGAPLGERRALLEEALAHLDPALPVHLCPATVDPALARAWFHEFEGAGLDGVIAKRLTDPYTPDKRTLVKVKHRRTADCVVGGYRLHKDGKGVGSLLLGLYDDAGVLHHVGAAASFTAKRRVELLAELAPFLQGGADDRVAGSVHRWNAGKDMDWVALRPELVAEVTFGQLQEGRFRHGSQLLRWRPDRTPDSCRFEQLEVAAPVSFRRLVERRA